MMTTTTLLISAGAFQWLVAGALVLTMLSPLILLALLARDRTNKRLW